MFANVGPQAVALNIMCMSLFTKLATLLAAPSTITHSLESSPIHKASKNRRQYSESNTEAVLGHAGSSCAPRTTWGQYCL